MNGLINLPQKIVAGYSARKKNCVNVIETLKAYFGLVKAFLMAVVLVYASPAVGLGLGAATTESYIGEPLSIHIPLFNVSNPDSLEMVLSASDASKDIQLNAAIERANSQLAIRISSADRVNEPYLSFKLDLLDDSDAFTKEFTVLLDLSPRTKQSRARASSGATPLVQDDLIDSVSNLTSGNSAKTMGPYDWAKAGQIADSFGAVIDGQSLWRVARRINKAMDVSLDQMMWALYAENPDAFASESISSLQAGSFLKIPAQSSVSAISDKQAKKYLAALSTGSSSTQVSQNKPAPNVLDIQSPIEPSLEPVLQSLQAEENQKQTPAFQLTGLSETVMSGAVGSSTADQKSQEIIGSLAQTVGNLTQELIRKDKQISFLEEKVAALEAFAGIEAKELSSSSSATIPAATQQVVAAAPVEIGLSTDSQKMSTQLSGNQASEESSVSLFQILAIGLGLMVVLGLFFKDRIVQLAHSLNFFGSNDNLEFEPSVYAEPSREGNSKPSRDPEKDYSIMTAVEHTMDDQEALEGISYLSLEEGGTYKETAVEPDDEITVVIEQDLTFGERFDRLITEKDYGFARELLDFARYNEIDDQRYHCERLRLLQAMRDEDGFYEYYYEIEAKIPQFDQSLQTKISQLVVQLAQH